MLLCPSAHVVLNPDPEKGRTGSIQCGLASILERNGRLPRKVLLVPVDRPGWSVELVNNLLESKTTTCPVWNDRGGHPLLVVGTMSMLSIWLKLMHLSPLWFNESLCLLTSLGFI